jgi:PKD repeat protein
LLNVPLGSLDANFTANPTSGSSPLVVQFTDLSTEGAQTVTASATGYTSYSNSQVVLVSGSSVQLNISLSPQLTGSSVRIVLNWSTSPRDLDSHLRTPSISGSTYHVYFSNQGSSSSAPFAILDHDDTNGAGPETITISQFFTGTYKYYIYRYSSDGALTTSAATVQIYDASGLIRTFQVPTTGTGDYWYVCDIDGASRSITAVNRIQSTEVLSLQDAPEGAAPKKPADVTLRMSGNETQDAAAFTYNWSFGDGTTSTSQHPSKTYQNSGSYTVRLIVTSGSKSDTLTRPNYITVGTTNIRYATSVLNFSSQYGTGAWAAAQLLGPPNVYPLYGDISEAWASSSQDAQREYLELGFSNPAPASSVAIWETFNPGAVDTIYVKNPTTNQWDKVWSGTASTKPAVSRMFVANFPLTSYNVSQVRIAINSPAVPSWNEIDAVGISNLPITSVEDEEDATAGVPQEFMLRQNYPNPFNPTTAISYQLSAVSFVTLKVTDVLGREVATLVNGVVAPGAHTVMWDGKSDNREQQPSGVYFYTLKTADKSTTKRMILMK